MNNHNKRADDKYSDYETLLDDLYSLQKNLLPEEKITAEKTDQLPPSVTAEDVQNLEIPILSDVVDSEIDQNNRSQRPIIAPNITSLINPPTHRQSATNRSTR